MSDDRGQLDLREQIARIDRDRAEMLKLVSETHRLDKSQNFNFEKELAETRKFAADQWKLVAEAQKFDRESRWFVPLALISNPALTAAIGTVVAELLH